MLHNIDVNNHFSALQYPTAVQEYLDKEKSLGVYSKKFISKRALQSLLGKLLYLHKCLKPARIFVNRILTVFRKHHDKSKILISEEFRQDIQWFITFLPHFNGVTILKKEPIRNCNTLYIDASLCPCSTKRLSPDPVGDP